MLATLMHVAMYMCVHPSVCLSIQGVLDLLANRCLAQGTNAWTDVDHTCYTVTTAGSEGFLNLLPIYLDHILYPTLTVSPTPPHPPVQGGVVQRAQLQLGPVQTPRTLPNITINCSSGVSTLSVVPFLSPFPPALHARTRPT